MSLLARFAARFTSRPGTRGFMSRSRLRAAEEDEMAVRKNDFIEKNLSKRDFLNESFTWSENIVPVSIFGFFVPVGTFFALNYEQEWLAQYDGRNTVFFPTKYQSDKGIPEPQWAGHNAKLYRQRKAASASQE